MSLKFELIKKAKGKTKFVESSFIHPEYGDLKLIPVPVSQNLKQPASETIFHTVLKRWLTIDRKYKEWCYTGQNQKPGSILDIAVQSDIWVVLMLLRDKDGNAYQDQDPKKDAMTVAMKKLFTLAEYNKGSIHVSNSVFSEFDSFEKRLNEELVDKGINVNIYTK